MKKWIAALVFLASCHHAERPESLSFIQIQDRNGLTETISNPDRLPSFEALNFLEAQPYKKVIRVFKGQEKTHSVITTYHPNGTPAQYLEAEEMRAHGAYKEWFPSGQLKLESRVVAGTGDLYPGVQKDWMFDGESRVWNDQGALLAAFHYSKGSLEGESTHYFPDGQIEKILPFVKNRLQGEGIEFWPDGTLKSKTGYQKGIQHGAKLLYFQNGELASSETYAEGRLQKGEYYNLKGERVSSVENGGGYQAIFDENGRMHLIEYRMGLSDGLVRTFDESGQLLRSCQMKNGKKQGPEIEYYAPSKPKMEVQWNENKIHGCAKTWYDNGQLQSQREYARNSRSGPSLAWYRDGSLMLYEEYENDQLVTGQYYKMQKKDPVSSVIQGNGTATLFDEEGLFLRKIAYVKGKPVDPED